MAGNIEIPFNEYKNIRELSKSEKTNDQYDYVETKSLDMDGRVICIKIEQLRYDESDAEWQTRYCKPTNKED